MNTSSNGFCKSPSAISPQNTSYVHFSVDPLFLHYRPQRSWGKVMFLQASVILFTGGGVPDQVPPPDQVHYPPLGPGTPPGPGPPRRDQGDTVYARAVRILLECILVHNAFTFLIHSKLSLAQLRQDGNLHDLRIMTSTYKSFSQQNHRLSSVKSELTMLSY